MFPGTGSLFPSHGISERPFGDAVWWGDPLAAKFGLGLVPARGKPDKSSGIKGATCTPRGAAHRVVRELCQCSSASLVLQPRSPGEAAQEGAAPSLASLGILRGGDGSDGSARTLLRLGENQGRDAGSDGLEHLWGC